MRTDTPEGAHLVTKQARGVREKAPSTVGSSVEHWLSFQLLKDRWPLSGDQATPEGCTPETCPYRAPARGSQEPRWEGLHMNPGICCLVSLA